MSSVIEGSYGNHFADAQAAQQSLRKAMKKDKVKGFAEVVVSEDVVSGINYTIQTAGVGGLRHNTVVVGWPQGWRHKTEEEHSYRVFIGEYGVGWVHVEIQCWRG